MSSKRRLVVLAGVASALVIGGVTAKALHIPSRLRHHFRATPFAELQTAEAKPSHAPAAKLPPVSKDFEIEQPIFSGGLKNEWQDWGWADRKIKGPGPAQVNFAGYGGWILHHDPQSAEFGALVFRMKAPKDIGDFLEVQLFSDVASLEPITITSRYRFAAGDGWTQVVVPWYELNPYSQPFDGFRLRAFRDVSNAQLSLDAIALTKHKPGSAPVRSFPSKDGVVTIKCSAPGTPISPMIYGVASRTAPEEMRAGGYRYGGNPTSRFNWTIGNVWNTADDWYYRNVTLGGSWTEWLDVTKTRNADLSLTLPMLGWVAKDGSSYSFPVSVYGKQEGIDPDHPDMGNGIARGGKPIKPGDPRRTSIPAPPEQVGKWVEMIQAEAQKRGRPHHSYILDNEPNLWNTTHRDVHPEPLTYDELLERTIKYGTAIRKADPQAIIAGPAEWGWSNYFWSAKDAAEGFSAKPDRRAHGDVPLLDWYLQKLNEHEKKTGVRILDVVDLHFYPQSKGLYSSGDGGATTLEASLLRIRSTRGLWDRTYLDESWINDRIYLLPRMKEIIARTYPGRQISIGEWNFGAEGHISGGLATAEALGRFAEHGIRSAYFWTSPKKGTPAYWAFRAFRNYDGQGAGFQDRFIPSTSPKDVSVFASRDVAGKRVVAIVLVLSNTHAFKLNFDAATCGKVESWKTLTYGGKPDGFKPSKSGNSNAIADTLNPFSMAVVDIVTSPAPSK